MFSKIRRHSLTRIDVAQLHEQEVPPSLRARRRADGEKARLTSGAITALYINDTYALPREPYEQGIRHFGAVRGGVRITDHSVNFDSDQCAAMVAAICWTQSAGLSPAVLAEAWFDWLVHLAVTPASR
jgi:Poly-beta-hydroxybutyrate polymerase N terminal